MRVCVLVARDGSTTTVTVPSLPAIPPSRIRVPSHLGEAALVDVYSFFDSLDSLEWVYHYSATLPLSTDETGDAEPPHLGPPRPPSLRPG
jgi:hypothetical protein